MTIRHENRFVAGVPDVSVTGNTLTSWWEVKYLEWRAREVQVESIKALARAGICYYVYYAIVGGAKHTVIVEPKLWGGVSSDPRDWAKAFVGGFDHDFVVEFVRKIHTQEVS